MVRAAERVHHEHKTCRFFLERGDEGGDKGNGKKKRVMDYIGLKMVMLE